MNIIHNFSVFSLIANASIMVQSVMALLLVLSLMSWTFIFRKAFSISNIRSKTGKFEQRFWHSSEIFTLYQDMTLSHRRDARKIGALERIFESGMNEFNKSKISLSNESTAVTLNNAQRAMHAATQREIDSLESSLSFLASVGSVSPYIGLLGTVWGIMNAFRGLANLHHVTLATVAPGIAEALIATTAGLLAAIPAVVAYNFFTHDIDRLTIRFENFTAELSNILQRQSC